jgi:hypothetical protein
MMKSKIDTLVMLIADQNGGKSNQMRSVFEEPELWPQYEGYPKARNIRQTYDVHPDMQLYVRLSSWHEKKESYLRVKRDIRSGHTDPRRSYRVFIAAQVTATKKLIGGEELFMRLFDDFEIRRGFAIWVSPDRSDRSPFRLTPQFARFMSTRRYVSALSIDGLALHPSAAPASNSINARLLADFLFRA